MSGKKPPPQEMAQVDRTETSSSSFWRSRPSPGRNSSAKSATVIGASYSHADMLKFDSLSLGSNSRPHTPPLLSATHSPSPPLGATRVMSPSRQAHVGTAHNPSRQSTASKRFEEEEEDEFGFEDNEDEFGLPSIASIGKAGPGSRLAPSRYQSRKADYSQSTRSEASLGLPTYSKHLHSGSFDIAEERNPLSYPSAKKADGKILRPQYKEILRDPANALHLIQHSAPLDKASPKETDAYDSRIKRINKFKRTLQASSVSLTDLRALAWAGVPEEVRAMTWQLLLGYLPANGERRIPTLERKRKEYLDGVRQAFDSGTLTSRQSSSTGLAGLASNPPINTGRGRGLDEAVWHQISIDVPRTNPRIPLYAFEATQRSLERILYVWAIRHPASGYVQGINDLVTPFWQVFLGAYITDLNIEEGMDPGQLPRPVLDAVEADTFWCLTKLLDGIQDNYIHAQPGIHRQVTALHDLIARIDGGLAKHLENEGVEFMQFSFRWMNCLLMREVSIKNTIRMWDAYLSEEQGFSKFHLYVCAAFLVKWSEQLLKMDFQEVMMFLQALPTQQWTEKDIEMLLSEAWVWQSLFSESSAHLRNSRSDSPSYGSLGPP